MARMVLSALLGVSLCVGVSVADDQKNPNPKTPGSKDTGKAPTEAKITKVDAKKHTLTVRMKGKDGKEIQKTFRLTEEVRYADSTGKVVAIDVFKNGDDVMVLEADGKLTEVRQKNGGTEKKK